MTKKRSTKRALLISALSLLMCVSMLIGSTYAWFTDSVTSGNNVIKSGNLDLDVQYTLDGKEWKALDGATDLFQKGLWEPGHTEVVVLKVENKGSLALKYVANMNVVSEIIGKNMDNENITLSDILTVNTLTIEAAGVDPAMGIDIAAMTLEKAFEDENAIGWGESTSFKDGNILEQDMPLYAGSTQYVFVKVDMAETVGNEANHNGTDVPSIEFGINVFATQYTHEYDSFGNQYDANAEYPLLPGKFEITNLDELNQAMKAGGEGTVMNDIDSVYAELPKGNKLALNLNGQTLTGTADNYVIVNNGTLSLTGDGTIASNLHGSVENWGSLVVDGLTLNVTGSKYGFHCKAGEVVINDIDLNAQRGGLNVQGGKVTVNSGTVTTTNYNTSTGYVVYAANYDDGTEVVINGGDFRYAGKYAKHRILCAQGNATIIVNGGTFGKGGSSVQTSWIRELDGGEVIIYGGSFEFDPSNWVAEGYEAVKGTDGWWTVSQIAG